MRLICSAMPLWKLLILKPRSECRPRSRLTQLHVLKLSIEALVQRLIWVHGLQKSDVKHERKRQLLPVARHHSSWSTCLPAMPWRASMTSI